MPGLRRRPRSSAEEVGEILGTTMSAVKSSLQRGRSRLREWAREAAGPSQPAPLPEAQQQLLRRYVALFNARDFDALRAMLAADVQLDLVTRPHRRGEAVGSYFTQYGQMPGWRAWPGVVEGRAAVLMQQAGRVDAQPDYFVVLDWSGQQVSVIRDFYYARYALADAALRAL